MNITYSIFSDKGNREINEDSVEYIESVNGNNCYVLCDGLGGHGMGDVASQLVVSVIKELFKNSNDCKKFIANAFETAQNCLLTEQQKQKAKTKMKTTAVVLVTDNKKAYIGHIGDSRAYVFNKNEVRYRTLDHSVPQMLVLSKKIKESEIRNHPDRSMLIKVMGIDWDEPQYEIMKPFPLRKCQAFLLCSDGFWELIDETEMCSLLQKSESVEEWLNSMVKVVKLNGQGRNMDNYSAVAVWNK